MPLRHIIKRSILDRLTDRQRVLLSRDRVYKFYHKEAESLIFDSASIRIGTLAKYRDIENSSLRDDYEGRSTTTVDKVHFPSGQLPSDVIHPSSAMYQSAIFQSIVGSGPRQGDIKMEEVDFFIDFDFYVYSFSYGCDSKILKSFDDLVLPPYANKPFDRVAIIDSISGLAASLVRVHPVLRNLDYCIFPVIYTERIRTPNDVAPDILEQAFEKPRIFSGNKEGRIVFFKEYVNLHYKTFPVPKDEMLPTILKFFRKGCMPA